MTVRFNVGKKLVTVDGISKNKVPIVYMNWVFDQGTEIYRKCIEVGCDEFTLVTVSNLDWDKNLAPWYTPKSYPPAAYCNGDADQYLQLFLSDIIPETYDYLETEPLYSACAGYSLAGLFSIYAAYKTDMFDRLASASGSFWFPGFIDYVKTHEMLSHPSKIYFSLGNQEAHSSVKQFDPVQKNTEWLANYYKTKGIETTFVLNPGNHYFEPIKRMADGIKWMLQN